MIRWLPILVLLGPLVAGPQVLREPRVTNRDERSLDDRLPDGSSRTLARIKEDQKNSLRDIARIRRALDELETELSKSEFLVSMDALKSAEEIEKLAKDVQGRLKRRR